MLHQYIFLVWNERTARKRIHLLRSEDRSAITGSPKIRRYATCFYRELYKKDYAEDLALAESFYSGLPCVDADTNTVLDKELSLEELYTAAMSLGTGEVLGIDGLPVEFYKSF